MAIKKAVKSKVKSGAENEVKRPIGRPKFTIEDLDARYPDWDLKMRELAQEGSSQISAMAEFGLSQITWTNLISDSERFKITVSECKVLCQNWWETRGRDMTKDGSSGSALVWKFNMQNRFGWKDALKIGQDLDAPFTEITKKKELTKDELIEQCRAQGLPLTMFERTVEDDDS